MGIVISLDDARKRLGRVPIRNGRYILTFNSDGVRYLYEHAVNAEEHCNFDPESPYRKGLYLMATGDVGCYLLSSGKPPLKADGTKAAPGEKDFEPMRVFAHGLSSSDDGWYRRKLQVFGSDQIVDTIPLSSIKHGLSPESDVFEIGITETSIFVMKPAIS